ncbi:MAG: UDP-4-amino-4,6-dideoxy-N-acetyl-beta-L-altrosamine N-acetyltransferase [Pelistega sp.]|nr:UDP-4-amino-4,6-dideoxy-N-acetyl-beta-L-altrosamine N-acetyltransferase [Pelistega sp.]
MIKGNIRPVNLSDAEMILEWRNQDSVRLNMYNHETISLEDHLSWFKSMLENKSCRYFIYEHGGVPLGVLSFSEIDTKNKKASWAFYSGDTSIRGIGSEMEQLALSYAFNELELHKLCCEVLEFNTSVISFHRKFGFKIEGVKKQDYHRGGKYYDIYMLALFKEDYLETINNKPLIERSFSWDFVLTDRKINELVSIKHEIDKKSVLTSLVIAEISRVSIMKYPAKNAECLSQKIVYNSPITSDVEFTGKASLKTQIGKFAIIDYSIFQNNELIVNCESEFILHDGFN